MCDRVFEAVTEILGCGDRCVACDQEAERIVGLHAVDFCYKDDHTGHPPLKLLVALWETREDDNSPPKRRPSHSWG